MENGFAFLVEKEEMWAKMLLQVLNDHGIPCTARAVFGAGLTIRAGARERLRIYVPEEFLPQASELTNELFSDRACDSPEKTD